MVYLKAKKSKTIQVGGEKGGNNETMCVYIYLQALMRSE